MRYFANPDANGNIIGFYNDDIWELSNIPSTAKEITFEQWQTFIEGNAKWDGSVVRLKTQTELDAEEAARPLSPPSTEDRLSAAEAAILSLMGL